VQVPAAIPVTVVPEIVHTEDVVEVSVTARPEVTVAVTAPVAGRVILDGTVKVIVWPPFPKVIFCITCGAALYVVFPDWLPKIVQMPAATPVTVPPLTVQTVGVVDVNVTARPEVAVALTVPLVPTVTVGAVPKVIVWFVLAAATVIDCVTWEAAL
jgi:hypothetical protein